MNTDAVDDRLRRLRGELGTHAQIARHLGLDFDRPIRALGDGYPENTVALVGKITERLLKQLWNHHGVLGDPSAKALNDLIKGCKPYIADTNMINSLADIQRLRNRSTHDGYEIADEDGLLALRRLLDILGWFTTTAPGTLTGEAPRLTPLVEAKTTFLVGLYSTLGYQVTKRFELSESTVYLLFVRQTGLRIAYVEIILSRSLEELAHVARSTGGELLRTRLPKLTRFIVVDSLAATYADGGGPSPEPDVRIIEYDRFIDTIVDMPAHLAAVASGDPRTSRGPGVSDPARYRTVTAERLDARQRTGEMSVTATDDAEELLATLVAGAANVLVLGRPGSGKTTLLKRLATREDIPGRQHRFYLDLSLKEPEEDLSDFVTRILAPYMAVEKARVFDVFLYLIRAGSVLCILDAVDEAVRATSLDAFLDLFAEIAQVLSASSAVVMSSRYSFLADSPEVRRLLHNSSLVSERVVGHLHATGVDPLELPRFHAVRLHDLHLGDPYEDSGRASGEVVGGASPLELHLAAQIGTTAPLATTTPDARLAALLDAYIRSVLTSAGLGGSSPPLTRMLGHGFLAGQAVFSLLDICSELGTEVFAEGRIDLDTFRLAPLFRPAGGASIMTAHSVFQEYFAALFLRTPQGRAETARILPEPLLTEQVRAFLHHLPTTTETGADPDPAPEGSQPQAIPPGVYLVGPSHRLLLREIDEPVELDQFPVTVARYREFLDAVARHGSAAWDHPDTPAGHTHDPWWDRLRFPHDPWWDRLRFPDYYSNPDYDDHPAICVDWWSAYAFARFDGGRLPTSTEWEVAARGTDGRLFPWGDDVDVTAVNCADFWAGHPLVTYETWKSELDGGRLHASMPTPVTGHPANISPFGVRGMAGNVWEWTATVLGGINSAVICGGSYDNPYRAVQTSSKGLYTCRGRSNAVGFRCARIRS